jgi:hypothetical protein
VFAVADGVPAAAAAIAAGAGLIDLWDTDARTVAAFRVTYPDVLACARADWAALVRDRTLALRTGAMLICGDAIEAERAEAAGIGLSGLLVQAPPAGVAGLLAAGWQVIVEADGAGTADPQAAAATGAIACWLGAAAVRTRHVTAVRRAIDMTASIRGTRPVPRGYGRP